jgi:hypothetical protein
VCFFLCSLDGGNRKRRRAQKTKPTAGLFSRKPKRPKEKVFGKAIDPHTQEIPPIIRLTVSFLEEKGSTRQSSALWHTAERVRGGEGLSREGIFRISAPLSEVEAVRELYESGKDIDFNQYDIHTVAGLLVRSFATERTPHFRSAF